MSRPARFPGCHPGVHARYRHGGLPWTCRWCGIQRCAACAHHFATARVMGARICSCQGCSRRLAEPGALAAGAVETACRVLASGGATP